MINTSHQPITPETQVWQWVMRVVGLIATVAVTVYITKVAQKALDQSVALTSPPARSAGDSKRMLRLGLKTRGFTSLTI